MIIIQLYRVFSSTYLLGNAFDSKCSLSYFIFGSPCSGIQKQISTSSTIRKLIAVSFIKVSLAYMEFKRIYEVIILSKSYSCFLASYNFMKLKLNFADSFVYALSSSNAESLFNSFHFVF